jgi:archaellum biogenesis ATPase FlaH
MKQKTCKYSAFGLTFDSQICIPELCPGYGMADVNIVTGIVPFEENEDVTYRISRTEFAFKIDEIAKFLVKNGNSIVVDICGKADMKTLRAYLLGTAFGMLMIQKDTIPIHGSAVVVGGKAVIITGDCGAGKTTLSSWFQKSGYGYLSDDISAIRFDSKDTPAVHPSFVQQRINIDTALHLEFDLTRMSKASLHDNKYVIIPKALFVTDPKPLNCIVQLKEEETDKVKIEKVTGIDKVHYLLESIYCAVLYQDIGFSKSYFSLCMKLAEKISMYTLKRPKGSFTAEQQMRSLLSIV